MKRLYDIHSNRGIHLVSAAIIFVSLLCCVNSVFAAAVGGFDGGASKGVTTTLYANGSGTGYNIYKTDGGIGGNGHDFGVISSLFIGDSRAYYFQSGTGDKCPGFYNICGCSLNWQVRNTKNSSIVKNGNYNLSDQGQSWSNCYNNSSFYNANMQINVYNSLAAGDYKLELWYALRGGEGTENCGYTQYYKNGNDNFYVKFTLPGFSSTSTQTLDFKDVNRGAEPENASNYSHYGDVPSIPDVVNCEESEKPDGYTNKPDMFEVTQITNSYIKFKFKTSNGEVDNKYCAKVVITEPHGKGNKTVIVKGKVITPQPEVRISEEAIVKDGPHTTMFGYVKYTGCKTIDAVGFVYSTSDISGDPAATLSGTHIDLTPAEVAAYNGRSGGSTINQGDLFSKTKYGLTTNTTYHYRAYIHSATAVNGNYYFFSEQKDFTAGQTCDFTSVGDTVYYTIDGSKEADWCSLRFPSLAEAVADMKTSNRGHSAWMNNTSGDENYHCLTKPVVFEVVSGTYGDSDNSTRDTSLEDLNTKSVSTYTPTPTKPDYRLIIRAKDPSKKMPVFKGGLSLMKARYITFKDVEITRNSSTSAHDGAAVELGVYPSGDAANACVPGTFANADIEFIHCKIDATGFNCIHAAGCGGLKFDQCEFKMNKPTYATDAANKNCRSWGGSVKLMSCKNVQFTRNSLKGSHATTLFLQYVQDMLVMNNVFWNNNQYTENVAFVRPVVLNYDGHTPPAKNTNIGIYYNTFYLADAAASPYCVDFLRFGCYDNVYDEKGTASTVQKGNTLYYDQANMYFKYNNCYSYDDQISQRSGDSSNGYAFQSVSLTTNNYTPNNFWSEGDGANRDNTGVKCGMAFPAAATVNTTGGDGTVQHINVKHIVCQSTADNPDDLVVSGDNLNIGDVPSSSAVPVLNEASLTLADRFDEIARPENGTGWTYGAFQQTLAPDPVSTIIWAGSENDRWDIRGNWRTEDGKRLSCVYGFTDNLTAIIPNGTVNSPLIPAWGDHRVDPFTDEATDPTTAAKRGKYPKEYVEAGRKPGDAADKSEIKKFVDVFDLKYGATVKGVENLGAYGNANTRYTQAVNTFMVPRSKWVFISSVIKPWDSDGPQNVRGLDLFLDGVPQVYLAELGIEDEKLTLTTYTDTWTSLPAEKGWAIRIPDQYGPKRQKAVRYYEQNPTAEPKIWGNDSIKYYFNGRFYNETAVPTYSELKANDINIVSNTYPANINASVLNSKLAADSKGSVQFFDTNLMSFRAVAAGDTIRSQQTFLIETAAGVTEVTVCDDATHTVFINGSSRHVYTDGVKDLKSAEYVNPFISIDAINLSSGTGSNIVVSYDELKDDSYNVLFDGRKLFNDTEITAPEVYMLEYDKKLCSYTTPTLEREIPLGLRLFQKMNVRFYIRDIEGLTQAEIIDREMETSFDIVNDGPYYTVELEAGTYEGRFYLNLGATASSIDEPIITEVEAMSSDENGISIFSKNNHVIVSAAGNIELHTLEIINMAGVVKRIPLANAHYNSLDIDSAPGVYIVKAIGSTMSRTEKIIIK